MKIDRVHIEHYKSLSNVTVEMHPRVTVLVGPNGSGKSNFVDALELMRDLGAGEGLDAIDARGGFARVREAVSPDEIQSQVEAESLCEVSSQEGMVYFKMGNAWVEEAKKFVGNLRTSSNLELAISTYGWKFPNFTPNQLSEVKPVQTSKVIAENLTNWTTIFHADGKHFERAVEAMRVVLPDLVDIKITPAGNSYLIPTFHFKDENGIEKSFDAAQLSDGTLHIFGLLLTLYQSPSPEVIVIEEPEQYLYPSMLALLADCIKEVSELTQIILTTHSHHLVEQFKLENIRVTTQKNGKTSISLVKKSQCAAVEQGFMTLGEIMAADGLYPETGE